MIEDVLPLMSVIRANKQASRAPKIETTDGSHAKNSSTFGNVQPTLLEFIDSQ